MGRKKRHGHKEGGPHVGRDLLTSLRQATFPGPIRIARSPYDQDLGQFIDRFLADAQARSEARDAEASKGTLPARKASQPGEAANLGDFFTSQMELMIKVGTGLWRLRQKSQTPEAAAPANDARRSPRHLESVWDAIADAGFNIVDHTNQAYEPRMALHVVSIEPTAGQVGEVVLETLKPSIYYKDRRIQIGEVIVAVPEHTEPPPDAGNAAIG